MKASDFTNALTPEWRLRLASSAVLAPLFLLLVYFGGAAYAVMIALITMIGLFEWLRLVDADAPLADRYGIFAAHALAVFFAAIGSPLYGLMTVFVAGIGFYAHRSNVTDSQHAAWFALGLPYMAGGGIGLIYLRALPSAGAALTLYLLAIVWGMDIGAYCVGRKVGGPKLAPVISPNKTWSGFFGGMALAMLLATPVLLIGGAASFSQGLGIAALLAAVAQGGDLFKSFFKRRAGVKDCGDLIPGHGGVLDRIDGLVFAAMTLAIFEGISGNNLIW